MAHDSVVLIISSPEYMEYAGILHPSENIINAMGYEIQFCCKKLNM